MMKIARGIPLFGGLRSGILLLFLRDGLVADDLLEIFGEGPAGKLLKGAAEL